MSYEHNYQIVTATHEWVDARTEDDAFSAAQFLAAENAIEMTVVDPSGRHIGWARTDGTVVTVQGARR